MMRFTYFEGKLWHYGETANIDPLFIASDLP